MNNLKSAVVVLFFSFSFFMVSCDTDTPAEKLAQAQQTAKQANADLEKAKDDYIREIDAYRRQAAQQIAANNKNMSEINSRLENEKKSVSAEYKLKMSELQLQNAELQKKMDDYRANGKDDWEVFKTQFGKKMDELGNALRDLELKKLK